MDSNNNLAAPFPIAGLSSPQEIHRYYYYDNYIALTKNKEVYTSWNATLVPGLSNVKSIVTGENYYCTVYSRCYYLALKGDGTLCGVGDNSRGQFGINAPDIIPENKPLCSIEDLIVEPDTVIQSLTVTKTGTGDGTVTSDIGTIHCGTTCEGRYPQGQTVTLRAKPTPGSAFTGWSGDCSTTDTTPVTTATLTGAVSSCTANFDKIPNRKLTVIKTGNGTVTSEPPPVVGNLDCRTSSCTVEYFGNTDVTLNATPAADSEPIAKINCTGGQPAGTNYWKFTITKDLECTVAFKLLANYPLNVIIENKDGASGKIVSEPAGIDCHEDCTKEFFSGTIVTLTLLPNPDSTWVGNCYNGYNSYNYFPVHVQVRGNAVNCSITFEPTPHINVEPPSYKFKFESVGKRLIQDFSIANTSVTNLRIGSIAVNGASDFRALEDNCSNTIRALNENCQIDVAYEPHTEATQTATLWIYSNNPNTPPVTIPFCAGVFSSESTQTTETNPTLLDFGTEVIGNSLTLPQWIKSSTNGCGALIDQEKFTLSGNHAEEFGITSKECYYAAWDDGTDRLDKPTYSTCRVNIKFLPTAEGTREAQLNYALNDISVVTTPVPLTGTVVNSAQPKLETSATSLNLGEVVLYRSSPQSPLTITNTGNVNVNPGLIQLTGPDAGDFSVTNGKCAGVLFPSKSCNLDVQLAPQGTLGTKQATLLIASGQPYATEVSLTGNSIEATDCAPANITIESSGKNDCWYSSTAWTRSQNSTKAKHPTENDVVRIKSGHTLRGPASATTVVKALCVENGATLQSFDNRGTSLAIQATQFIGNWGTILGQDGANETAPCTKKASVGTRSCAKPGASVILKAGRSIQSHDKLGNQWWESYESGGPIVNEGIIRSGKGGNGSQYAAAGGDAIVLGRNTLNKNTIQAGDGGDILGTSEGESGPGGITQVWGNRGGKGYLRSEANTQISAGNGGHCNPKATEAQMGGQGGNLWFMTFPDIYLGGGSHRAGRSSPSCAKSLGDGQVRIDPSVISLAGANTKVEGGNIFIYGGDDWTLDLSNLTGPVVTSTGNITLAVGKGGSIDLRGSTGKLFNAKGQVNFFADQIRLDENQKLSDLIQASQIVVGPSKLLHGVSLMGATRVIGGPNATISLTLTLANGSPVNDTFSLKMTDASGWSVSQLPATIEVAGLETIDLKLDLKLPADVGMMDTITVTATSQAEPTVTATTEFQAEVVEPLALPPPRGITLTGENQTWGWPNSIMPLTLTLTNESPVSDTFLLTVTDTQGWILNQGRILNWILNSLPATVDVEGKKEVDLTLGILIPPTLGLTDTITVTATSQADPTATATANLQVTVALPPPDVLSKCPPTGVIDFICSNHGQVLTDAILGAHAIVSGGKLAGTINSQGFVSQVLVQPDAVLTGGTLSGYVLNQGTIADVTFVGVTLQGGTLAGTIRNKSQVGGTLIDVTLAPNAHVVGGRMQGNIQGDPAAPAWLEEVRVLKESQLLGVKLGKGVVLEEEVEK